VVPWRAAHAPRPAEKGPDAGADGRAQPHRKRALTRGLTVVGPGLAALLPFRPAGTGSRCRCAHAAGQRERAVGPQAPAGREHLETVSGRADAGEAGPTVARTRGTADTGETSATNNTARTSADAGKPAAADAAGTGGTGSAAADAAAAAKLHSAKTAASGTGIAAATAASGRYRSLGGGGRRSRLVPLTFVDVVITIIGLTAARGVIDSLVAVGVLTCTSMRAGAGVTTARKRFERVRRRIGQ
jgi:hypothetical protein